MILAAAVSAGAAAGVAAAAGAVAPAVPGATPRAAVTTVRDEAGRWHLHRGGRPFVVRGVGGSKNLELAAAIGANTIRTWGIETLRDDVAGKPLADRAHELGLSIVAGIWVKHERHGFDYKDPAFLQAQRDEVRAAVRRYRDHPAILVWGLGNEMEHHVGPGDPLRIWRELEILARIVREEDPSRPIMTVLAGSSPAKVRAVIEHCPTIDILGVNSYGWAPLVTYELDEAGWDKPWMLTEFGPRGQWEIMHTPWGVPIEPRSIEKLASYVGAHRSALADPRKRCIGTFCFTWGQKQEVTATWYGMFLATGEKTPIIDAMAYEFTGHWPANRSPLIWSFKVPFALDRVAAGAEFTVSADVHDPEGDTLSFEWLVVAESTDRRRGGDREKIPPSFPEYTISTDGSIAVIRAPATPGPYRLFLYVRDGRGGAVAENVPFFVQ